MPYIPLSENVDFILPAGISDVRGWEVRTMPDGERIGEVDDILLDERGRFRYLDVDLGVLQKHVLLPIEETRTDEAEDVVWIPGMTRSAFERIPPYNHDPKELTPEYENALASSYAGALGVEGYRGGVPSRSTFGGDQLGSLSELVDFKIADEDPDPRGWPIIVSDGREIGRVSDLVVDKPAMKVRYLDCQVDERGLGLPEEGRHILIPIGYARLDEEGHRVIVDAITSDEVATMPIYAGLPLGRGDEERLHALYTGNPLPGWNDPGTISADADRRDRMSDGGSRGSGSGG